MNTREINGVLGSDIAKQYEYFIKKAADYEEVWSLKEAAGWASLELDGKCYFPVWPKKEFAQMQAAGEWDGYIAYSIDLEEFMEDWLPGFIKDGLGVTVMWNNGSGIDLSPERLMTDIETELEKYQ